VEKKSGGVKACAQFRGTGAKGGAGKRELTSKSHYCDYKLQRFNSMLASNANSAESSRLSLTTDQCKINIHVATCVKSVLLLLI